MVERRGRGMIRGGQHAMLAEAGGQGERALLTIDRTCGGHGEV
jgi:hypothetical protein